MQNERDNTFAGSPDIGVTPGTSRGSGTTEGSLDQAKATAQQLGSEAEQRVREQVQSRLEMQKQNAAQSLTGVAQSLRTAGRQLEGQQAAPSRYVQQAADRVEGLAHYLENRDVGEILDEVEDFARRQPPVFLGAAFALGVLGARFLKSSRRNLVSRGVREHWSTREMTNRTPDAEIDSVGRPGAPGYAPPTVRASSEPRAAGPRES